MFAGVKLVNSWIIFNSGGGPEPDKPEVIVCQSEDAFHPETAEDRTAGAAPRWNQRIDRSGSPRPERENSTARHPAQSSRYTLYRMGADLSRGAS
jgi:hypothetical protein